jgi:hypothetical protein
MIETTRKDEILCGMKMGLHTDVDIDSRKTSFIFHVFTRNYEEHGFQQPKTNTFHTANVPLHLLAYLRVQRKYNKLFRNKEQLRTTTSSKSNNVTKCQG